MNKKIINLSITMKKMFSFILLFSFFSITTYAETTNFIEDCRTNYTNVIVDSESNPVTVTGFDKLWDDRTVITEEDILNAETYNNENEDEMYYSLKLKVVNLEPFMKVQSNDVNGVSETTIIPNSKIAGDASLSALCTNQNFDAYNTIESAATNWYVVSIEKYEVHTDERLISAACNSTETYDISFTIPSRYSDSTDLKMAKISNGQVSFVDDVDSDNLTYTVTATGSAAYVFVGTPSEDNKWNTAISDIIVITPSPDNSPDMDNSQPLTPNNDQHINDTSNNSNISGNVTAPQTSDTNTLLPLFVMTLIAITILFARNKNNCAQ